MQKRQLLFNVKAEGTSTNGAGEEVGRVVAYTAIFNNVDQGNDIILPGAFAQSIKDLKARAKARGSDYLLPMCLEHDTNQQVGGWTSLSEDATGLRCAGDIALATEKGANYYKLAKSGMASSWSIMYEIVQGGGRYRTDGVRELTELRLFSCDPVVMAMNDSTYTVSVKSKEEHMSYKSMLDAVLRAHIAKLHALADKKDYQGIHDQADTLDRYFHFHVPANVEEDMESQMLTAAPPGYDERPFAHDPGKARSLASHFEKLSADKSAQRGYPRGPLHGGSTRPGYRGWADKVEVSESEITQAIGALKAARLKGEWK